jgi:hypothetical protein
MVILLSSVVAVCSDDDSEDSDDSGSEEEGLEEIKMVLVVRNDLKMGKGKVNNLSLYICFCIEKNFREVFTCNSFLFCLLFVNRDSAHELIDLWPAVVNLHVR